MVSEWIDGKKLSECPTDILNELIPDAQEAFLTQLLQVGFFHSDPHPGNILYMNEQRVWILHYYCCIFNIYNDIEIYS